MNNKILEKDVKIKVLDGKNVQRPVEQEQCEFYTEITVGIQTDMTNINSLLLNDGREIALNVGYPDLLSIVVGKDEAIYTFKGNLT